MSPNQVRPPTTASPSDPRGLSKRLPETISATFGVTRRKEGHPPPHCWDVTEMLLDLFFLLFSFFFSLAWHLAGQKPLKTNCSVALVFSLVSSTWSFLRWEEVFGDLASDAVTKCSRSQRWSLLGRTFDWSRAMDARVRKASKLSLGGIVVIQLWWLL
ncbi:hypothetical protein J008_02475, partial [Cryptococcus neoformans]